MQKYHKKLEKSYLKKLMNKLYVNKVQQIFKNQNV